MFLLPSSDGLSDIDICASIKFHREQGKLATGSGLSLPGRHGALIRDGLLASELVEKPSGDMAAFSLGGFWQLMDTLYEKTCLKVYGLRVGHLGKHGSG